MRGSGDYISREAVVNAINSTPFTMSMFLNEDQCVGARQARDSLALIVKKSIPAADVRPNVPGHWIYKPYKVGGMNINFPSCSECGYSPFVSMYYAVEDMHYCPNCGADMRPEPPKEE